MHQTIRMATYAALTGLVFTTGCVIDREHDRDYRPSRDEAYQRDRERDRHEAYERCREDGGHDCDDILHR